MPMSGQANAVLGALVGLGLGEATNALGLTEVPGRGRGTASGKYGYTNPVTGLGGSSDYVDSLLKPATTGPVPRRLPPVDGGGQPLDNMPEGENQGDINFQLDPNTGGELHPDKFDTVSGDALQVQRRARVFRAVSDASRINEILGQRQISRQQAAGLIRDYHQKYPDINIPIQPYTSEQAKELRGRALLAQKQDEAEALGLGREAYTTDPNTGLPVQNPVYFHKLQLDQQDKSTRRLMDAEKERVRLTEQAQTLREEAQRAHERRLNADAAYQSAIKMAPELPKEPNIMTATPADMARYRKEKDAYYDEFTGHDAIMKAAREQYMLDKGYVPKTANKGPVAPAWNNPHTALPAEAPSSPVAAQPAPILDPKEVARKASVPYFATPEEALKKSGGKPFVNSEGKLMVPKAPVAPPAPPVPQHEQDAAAVISGKVPLETALSWHGETEQKKIKETVSTVQQTKAVDEYLSAQANRVANGQLPIKDAMDELDSSSQFLLAKKLSDYTDIDDVARNQRYDDFADAVKKTTNVDAIESRLKTQLAQREANAKVQEEVTPVEQSSGPDARTIIAKLKAAEGETQVATKKRTRKTK